MSKFASTALAAALATTMLAGCATYTGQTDDPNDPNRTARGALIGAGIGAVAGLLSGSDATERRQRALVGAGVGAVAGGAVGAYQDRQEAELRRQTANTGVDVTREGDVIKLNLPDGVTFDFNRTEVKPQFYPALNNIAATLREFDQTVVEVSGHTDNIGTLAANQTVSERRAQSVTSYLTGQNLDARRFITVGMNYRYPVASNDTDAGRAQNRRVEIRIQPITE